MIVSVPVSVTATATSLMKGISRRQRCDEHSSCEPDLSPTIAFHVSRDDGYQNRTNRGGGSLLNVLVRCVFMAGALLEVRDEYCGTQRWRTSNSHMKNVLGEIPAPAISSSACGLAERTPLVLRQHHYWLCAVPFFTSPPWRAMLRRRGANKKK